MCDDTMTQARGGGGGGGRGGQTENNSLDTWLLETTSVKIYILVISRTQMNGKGFFFNRENNLCQLKSKQSASAKSFLVKYR